MRWHFCQLLPSSFTHTFYIWLIKCKPFLLLSKNTLLLRILVELFAEQYRAFQALQQDGAAGAVDGGGGDRHQRDPCSDQQHTGAAEQKRT